MPASRCSKDSPIHRITLSPWARAALVLEATNCVVSLNQSRVVYLVFTEYSTHLVTLAHQRSPLRMANKSPIHASILQLLCADFTGVCTVALIVDILSCDGNVFPGDLTREEEVERRR